MQQIRQGDILLTQVADSDAPAIEAVTIREIAQGEASGHSHVLEAAPEVTAADREAVIELLNAEGTLIRTKQSTILTHQEHATKNLEPGTWEVKRQQGVDPQGHWHEIAD